ncbi:hypothetical protein PUNSTDRAFT_139363 [Punctularia strigosozonata HHB-11173 SS5]|uniref:Uncharacterized protein n=1 Tax=Punctularia strigosozonata (strain HHB-11173) TaxID=741275 RepID=R7S1I7_PUNST|nr:uncharacterized protein PUNSTDRAFT_139363 [Punctularia strigosozonata HHB-11173 SS5]EIN03647.1 hypothetical protein PUNSTDRAFT_139363 [Punctularia strigosozonata HHB-11173 SS5]
MPQETRSDPNTGNTFSKEDAYMELIHAVHVLAFDVPLRFEPVVEERALQGSTEVGGSAGRDAAQATTTARKKSAVATAKKRVPVMPASNNIELPRISLGTLFLACGMLFFTIILAGGVLVFGSLWLLHWM